MDGWALLGLALFLGVRHALEPDHVVAVSTLAAEERRLRPAAWLGFVWGMGHLLPVATVGLPLVVFRLQLPARFEHLTEAGVGVLLIVLGLVTLRRLARSGVHFATHRHEEITHGHFHRPGHRHPFRMGQNRQRVTFAFGVAHGLGGSGAAAVMALQASPDPGGAVLWLLLFGAGTLLGMFLMTLCVAAPAVAVTSRRLFLHAAVRAAAALASLAWGGFILWSLLPDLLA
ncbi:hypothetical protein DYI95_008665 [Thermaerobacter sp. PB12/4term]|uniref:HoxN/HupN/NixA family nickel/cobalt transporter n=1 Tax=Thermaerobacter sp. PB12/4term TaxID=2293838 RepID=UPI000E329732|nr:hypothetical protein [Thermaerobacter sp. PB12/4term]QIA27580.1 hypothetical protein DYI95_008665 [Thermaerobacter sp. PB12/4term]